MGLTACGGWTEPDFVRSPGVAAGLLALVAALGCGGQGPLTVSDGGEDAADARSADSAAVDVADSGDGGRRPEDVDILFVIDDSPGMAEHQAHLPRKLAALIKTLENVPGGLPDLHVGVVTGDLGAGPTAGAGCRPGGDRGVLRDGAACGLVAGARFVVSSGNGTRNNFSGDLADAVACLARVETAGCAFQHPLEAARLALSGASPPENGGFLRAGAKLLIVLVTNQDDCSAASSSDLFTDSTFAGVTSRVRCAQAGHVCGGKVPPLATFSAPLEQCDAADGGRLLRVAELAQSIRALKARPEMQILVSAIVGWPREADGALYRYGMAPGAPALDCLPTCSGPSGTGTAALRIVRFVKDFGASGILTSICGDAYDQAVSLVGQRF
jgi:hypothetical protein